MSGADSGDAVEYLVLGHLQCYYKDLKDAKRYKNPPGFGFKQSDGTTYYVRSKGMYLFDVFQGYVIQTNVSFSFLNKEDKKIVEELVDGNWYRVGLALAKLTTENPFPPTAILRRTRTSDIFLSQTTTSDSDETVSLSPSKPFIKSQTNDLLVEVDGNDQVRTGVVCHTIGKAGHCLKYV